MGWGRGLDSARKSKNLVIVSLSLLDTSAIMFPKS